MFAENPWKSFLYALWTAFLFLAVLALHALEFLHFFIVTGENTLFDQPVALAARAEFFIMLLLSLPALAAGALLARSAKGPSVWGYGLCGALVLLSVLKLAFYLPNLAFGGMPVWYLLKQIPPVLFTGLLGILAFAKAADFKYQKYR